VRCPYAHEDGAYVLGALSPAERAAFERHLATCPGCRRAVAELAVLPGLLSRLPAPEDAASHVAAPPPGERAEPSGSRLPRLLEAAAATRRREHRARTWRAALAVFAAACLAVVVGVGVAGVSRDDGRPPTAIATPSPTPVVTLVAMKPAKGSRGPVSAEVGLAATGGGTEIIMHCRYRSGSDYTNPWTLRLLAYGPRGATEQVGSWTAGPGDVVDVTGVTRFRLDELVRLVLVKGDGVQLLTYDVI
jgi:Putative zinc-finger